MLEHFRSYCASLDNTSVFSQIAEKNSKTACCCVWIVDWPDCISIGNLPALNIFSDGLTCYCDGACIQQSFGCQLCHYCRDSAAVVQVVHVSAAGRCQVTEVRCNFTDFVESVKVNVYACFVGNCQQVKDAVG